MDRVPLLFIEEVLLQLDSTPYWIRKTLHYPSTWGKIAAKRGVKEQARVNLYLRQEPVFSIWSFHTGIKTPVPFEDLDQFVLEGVTISKEEGQGRPLTKANLQLLQRHLRRGYPCSLILKADFRGTIAEQLCLAAPQVVSIQMNSQVSPSVEILTRSIERGTLRTLWCTSAVRLTKKLFPVLLKLVASEQFKFLRIARSSGAISNEACLTGVINALLGRPRRQKFTFYVAQRYENLCSRLVGDDVRVNVEISRYLRDNCFELTSRSQC
uniref:Glycerophosphodiester phosphodiesterase n=1 Tax=Steinernema glaseri TaxID=37863 RepID=A0A1I8ACL2_9BILA